MGVIDQLTFPFDLEFQKMLLRVLIEDDGFTHFLAQHLQPQYFEHEVLAWAFATCQSHMQQYGGFPGHATLRQYLRGLDARQQPLYETILDQVQNAPLKDELWMRDATIDFAKRNLFHASYNESRVLYNAGRVTEAYDLMQQRMDTIQRTKWEPVDRGWYFEEYARRHNRRMNEDPWQIAVSTGLPWLDNILDGGLSLGELGIWIGYPKTGKSVMLVQMGIAAAKQEVHTLYFVAEGSRNQVEVRMDTSFTDELYHNVKNGDIDAEKYSRTWAYMQRLRGMMVIRGFTQRWDYSVLDIQAEMDELRRQYGWTPKCIVIDYGDLIEGRKQYDSEREKQKDVFRDFASLANRGHAVWTASQAQRPEKGAEDRAHWLWARQIAECYEKVRVGHFIGSVNLTLLEKANKVIRLLAELYRDNEAGFKKALYCDFSRMRIEEREGICSPSMPDLEAGPSLGYQNKQATGVQQQKAF
jgi:hypothetical protein